jgi:hypothetical protein
VIAETLQQIRRVSLDVQTDPLDRVHRINRLANDLLITLQAKPSESAEAFASRVLKLVPPATFTPEQEQSIAILAEAFLEGASCHKLNQIGLLLHNNNLLVTQKLARISSIVEAS